MWRSHSTQAQSRHLTADWLAPRESDCLWMYSKVTSDWLPSYIKATWPYSKWTDTFRKAYVIYFVHKFALFFLGVSAELWKDSINICVVCLQACILSQNIFPLRVPCTSLTATFDYNDYFLMYCWPSILLLCNLFSNLMHNFFIKFIAFLYMFRALLCSSSGGLNCIYTASGSWFRHSGNKSVIWIIKSSWRWA